MKSAKLRYRLVTTLVPFPATRITAFAKFVGEERLEKMGTSAYVYFCDGIQKQRFVVDSVSFADGSECEKRPTD